MWLDRLEYANAKAGQYLEWLQHVDESPWSAYDKIEFAIISAHTKMDNAINGWLASRNWTGLDELADTLYAHGVLAPYHKAAYISTALEQIRDGTPLPRPDFREWRRDYKLSGLGYCKASFAACLVAPFESDIVCLDTHMLQVYFDERPTAKTVASVYRSLPKYEGIENHIRWEAEQVGLPPFAYQWAVWDWKRAKVDHIPPENHSFLWRGGRDTYQLPMFSSLA
jgi:hypothetical protein